MTRLLTPLAVRTKSLAMGLAIDGFRFCSPPFSGMAKPNLYADLAAKQIEVAGRKLRTRNPEAVREFVSNAERWIQREGRPFPFTIRKGSGVLMAAVRLKGLN